MDEQPVASTSTATAPSAGNMRLVSAFLQKLINMVDDPETDELIHWSDDGNSFYVPHHDRFAKELLPKFFKHSNFSSFVRQLNMYNFHKIPHLQQGALRNDAAAELWQFQHDSFKRGRPDLLVNIVRKKPAESAAAAAPAVMSQLMGGAPSNLLIGNGESSSNALVQQIDLQSIVSGLQAMREHQSTISKDLQALQASNQGLWAQAISARDKYKKQSETINKILQFLAGVFGAEIKDVVNPGSTASSSKKDTAAASSSSSSPASTLSKDQGDSGSKQQSNSHKSFIFPKKKAQLLLGDGTIGSANFQNLDSAGNIELPLLEDDERDLLDFGDPSRFDDINEADLSMPNIYPSSSELPAPKSPRFAVVRSNSTTPTSSGSPILPTAPLPLSEILQASGSQYLLDHPFPPSMALNSDLNLSRARHDNTTAQANSSLAAKRRNPLPMIKNMPPSNIISSIPPLSPFSPSKNLIPVTSQLPPRNMSPQDQNLSAIASQNHALANTAKDSDMIAADIDAMQRSLQSLVQGMSANGTFDDQSKLEFDGDWNMDDFLASLSSQPDARPAVDTTIESSPFENESINDFLSKTPPIAPVDGSNVWPDQENQNITPFDFSNVTHVPATEHLPVRKKRKSEKISNVDIEL